jgi:hypothetical protein
MKITELGPNRSDNNYRQADGARERSRALLATFEADE